MKNIMDLIKERLSSPRNLAIAAGVAGILLGLLIGWVLLPVQWTDTTAETMRADLREDYLRMVFTNIILTFDQAKARQLYQELGKNAGATLTDVSIQSAVTERGPDLTRFFTRGSGGTSCPALAPDENRKGLPPNETGKQNSPLQQGLILLGLLVIGAAGVYIFYLRPRVKPAEQRRSQRGRLLCRRQSPARHRPQRSTQGVLHQRNGFAAAAAPQTRRQHTKRQCIRVQNGKITKVRKKPVAQFMTTYNVWG
jgi:hypothetical protein